MATKRVIDISGDSDDSDCVNLIRRYQNRASSSNSAPDASHAPSRPMEVTDSSASDTSESIAKPTVKPKAKPKGRPKAIKLTSCTETIETTDRTLPRKPDPKNVVSQHSKILFRKPRQVGVRTVAEILDFEPSEVHVQECPPMICDTERDPDCTPVLLSYTTIRARRQVMSAAAAIRIQRLHQELSEKIPLLSRNLETMHGDLARLREAVGDTAFTFYSASRTVGELEYHEYLDEADNFPADICELLKHSCIMTEENRRKRISGYKKFLMALDQIMAQLGEIHQLWHEGIETWVRIFSSITVHKKILDSFLRQTPQDEQGAWNVLESKVLLPADKTVKLLESLIEKKDGKFMLPQTLQVNGGEIPPLSVLIGVAGDRIEYFFHGDSKSRLIDVVTRAKKNKFSISFLLPRYRYSKYGSLKTRSVELYKEILVNLDELRRTKKFDQFIRGTTTVAPEPIEFFSRPKSKTIGPHLATNFAQAGLADSAEQYMLPNLMFSGASHRGVNGEYTFEAMVGDKPKYQKISDPSYKLYYNMAHMEWRIFRSLRVQGQKSPTLYVNSSSQLLPHNNFRGREEYDTPPSISVKTHPGSQLFGVFGRSPWRPIEYDFDSVARDWIRNPVVCWDILKNINSAVKSEMVTEEFVGSMNSTVDLYLRCLDNVLVNQILPHECCSPFGAPDSMTQGYSIAQKGWVAINHLHKSQLGLFRTFEQHVGASFNVSIQYRPDRCGCNLRLNASFENALQRLLYALYWTADVHRAKYCLQQRCEVTRDPTSYVLISNEDIPPAAQPRHFSLPLKPKQLCTLAWMIEREKQDSPFFTELELERTVFGSDLSVKLVLEREYHHVQGGILADEVGYGKTACVIALVASTLMEAPNTTPKKGFILSNATLIITPTNLFEQWLQEFAKFFKPKEFNKLRVVEISNVGRLKRVTVQDIKEADVVLVPTSFFFSGRYEATLNSIIRETSVASTAKGKGGHTQKFEATRYARLREVIAQVDSASLESAQEPVLEMFYYKRVIFDEFHEVMRMPVQRSTCAMMQLFGRCHWGLSGTPPLDSVQSVQEIANFLHISLSASVRETQHFINEWMRSNTWDRESVPIRNVMIKVNHTKEERALYMLQKTQFASSSTLESERLLQLCTHFNPKGTTDKKTAKAAVDRAHLDLTKKLDRAQGHRNHVAEQLDILKKQVQMRHGLAAALQSKDLKDVPIGPEDAEGLSRSMKMDKLKALLDKFIAEDTHKVVEEWRSGIVCNMNGNICSARKKQKLTVSPLHELLDAKYCMPLAENLDALVSSTKASLADAEGNLKQAVTCKEFFENTLKSLSSDEGQRVECSVCLGDTTPESCAVTLCGHLFHMDCIADCIKSQGQCPICRAALASNDMDLVHAVTALQPAQEPKTQTIGSKMVAIMSEVEKVIAEEHSAKIIMFVQWECILATISVVLKHGGYNPLRLCGSLLKRQATLREFIDSTDSQILLLSLEYSPTGMNLVCCHHVFLIHPMFADGIELSAAYEMQAIGRVRRQGQQHPVVVRRFVTMSTIEEELINKHATVGRIAEIESGMCTVEKERWDSPVE